MALAKRQGRVASPLGGETIASRVRWLIGHWYGGNVNKAARSIGMPQRTLAVIAAGEVKQPRVNALSRISAHFGVSLDWLVHGEGPAPEPLKILVRERELDEARERILDVFQKLGDDAGIGPVFNLVHLPDEIARVLAWNKGQKESAEHLEACHAILGASGAAVEQQAAAWHRFLQVAMERFGPREVSAALSAIRFSWEP